MFYRVFVHQQGRKYFWIDEEAHQLSLAHMRQLGKPRGKHLEAVGRRSEIW